MSPVPAPTPTRYVLVVHFNETEWPRSADIIEVFGTGHGCDPCPHISSITAAKVRGQDEPVDASRVSARILKFKDISSAIQWVDNDGRRYHVATFIE